jgi:hypothetical protein
MNSQVFANEAASRPLMPTTAPSHQIFEEFDILSRRVVPRRQHKALATKGSYLHWLRHGIAALSEMPQTLSSEQKLERFMSVPVLKRDAAASAQCRALNALAFAFRAVRRKPLPHGKSSVA